MDAKIKKFIAKEGLLLLCLILLAFILNFSLTNILAPIIMPKVQFSYTKLSNNQDSDKPRYEFDVKGKKFKIEFDSEPTKVDLSEVAIQEAITKRIVEPSVRWKLYGWLWDIKNAVFLYIFLIYLLIRFIIWALRTLKQKPAVI